MAASEPVAATALPWTTFGRYIESRASAAGEQQIGFARRQEDADLIVRAVNEYDALIDIAAIARAWVESGGKDSPYPVRTLGEIATDFKNALARLQEASLVR